MQDRIAYRGLTFDDVLLEPGYSEVVPSEVDISSFITRNIPAESADPQQPDGHGDRK